MLKSRVFVTRILSVIYVKYVKYVSVKNRNFRIISSYYYIFAPQK